MKRNLLVVALAVAAVLALSTWLYKSATGGSRKQSKGFFPNRIRNGLNLKNEGAADGSANRVLLGNINTLTFRELYGLLSTLSSEKIAELATQLDSLPQGSIANAKINTFFKAWTQVDARAAFEGAVAFRKRKSRIAALTAVFDTVDPASSGALVQSLVQLPDSVAPSAIRSDLFAKGVLKWSQVDPARATQFLGAPSHLAKAQGEFWQTRRQVAENWGAVDPEAALQWAQRNPGQTQLSDTMQGVIRGWWQSDHSAAEAYVSSHIDTPAGQETAMILASQIASEDPVAALAWAKSLSGKVSDETTQMVAMTWTKTDPAASAEWISSLSGAEQSLTIDTIVGGLSQADPETAVQWITALSGEAQNMAIASFGSTVGQTSPGTALAWAETTTDEILRNRWTEEIVGTWFQQNPAGVTSWIRESQLSKEEKKRLLSGLPGQ